MPYVLIGNNGDEYGPVELETLVAWANEGRVGPRSTVRITPAGESVLAHTIPELGLVDQPPKLPPTQAEVYSEYPRESLTPAKPSKGGLVSIIFWSAISVLLVIFTHTGGVITALLGLMDIVAAKKRNDHYFPAIAAIGGTAIVFAVIVTYLKLTL